MSFEGHPNNTTREHLQKLYDLGFRRVSFGVQDYSEKVQTAINRIQPYNNVARVTMCAKEIGYTSVGHDLIFGLPFQTVEDVVDTIEKTKPCFPIALHFIVMRTCRGLKAMGNAVSRMKTSQKMTRNASSTKSGKNCCSFTATRKSAWTILHCLPTPCTKHPNRENCTAIYGLHHIGLKNHGGTWRFVYW
jgi:radical SAM superfamily enzyme YgiQ (UPF0313 family)